MPAGLSLLTALTSLSLIGSMFSHVVEVSALPGLLDPSISFSSSLSLAGAHQAAFLSSFRFVACNLTDSCSTVPEVLRSLTQHRVLRFHRVTFGGGSPFDHLHFASLLELPSPQVLVARSCPQFSYDRLPGKVHEEILLTSLELYTSYLPGVLPLQHLQVLVLLVEDLTVLHVIPDSFCSMHSLQSFRMGVFPPSCRDPLQAFFAMSQPWLAWVLPSKQSSWQPTHS